MMLQVSRWLALTLAIAVSGQEHHDGAYNSGMTLQEDYSAESSSSSSSSSSLIASTVPKDHHNFLRRELQTSPSCRATSARNTYVCGGVPGVTTDTCGSSTATCDGLRYDCTCAGITETSCAYCQVRTVNSIMCQISGTTSTFVDPEYRATQCFCDYIGYGQVNLTCSYPEAQPISFQSPSTRPVGTPAPIANTFPTPAPAPASSPIWQSPFSYTQMSCTAVNTSNSVLEANANCSSLTAYPCTCSGSSETSCTYCQIRAFESILCMVTDSIETFTDPLGNLATCRCDYKGKGQAQSYCYEGAPPDIPGPPTPAPSVPTDSRVDTDAPVQAVTAAPVYVAPPVQPTTPAPVYVEPPVQSAGTQFPVYVSAPVSSKGGTMQSKKRRM